MEELGRTILDSIKIIDNKQKSLSYDGLAARCAELGDGWLALHSQILADSAKYKLLMLSQEQDFQDSLHTLEAAITESFASNSTQKSYKVVTIINKFRRKLVSSVPKELRKSFEEELTLLDGFDALKVSADTIISSSENNRFAVTESYEFIRRKQDEATRLYIQAMNLKDSDPVKSVVALYQGDLAVFESWLVAQSIVLEDESHVVAGLRWALASAALNNLEGLPNNTKKAAKEIRKSLLWAVGPENSKSLSKYLLKF
jgi:hypothetical protein